MRDQATANAELDNSEEAEPVALALDDEEGGEIIQIDDTADPEPALVADFHSLNSGRHRRRRRGRDL